MDMSFDYWIGEYMIYCRTKQLREKTMASKKGTAAL